MLISPHVSGDKKLSDDDDKDNYCKKEVKIETSPNIGLVGRLAGWPTGRKLKQDCEAPGQVGLDYIICFGGNKILHNFLPN